MKGNSSMVEIVILISIDDLLQAEQKRSNLAHF